MDSDPFQTEELFFSVVPFFQLLFKTKLSNTILINRTYISKRTERIFGRHEGYDVTARSYQVVMIKN